MRLCRFFFGENAMQVYDPLTIQDEEYQFIVLRVAFKTTGFCCFYLRAADIMPGIPFISASARSNWATPLTSNVNCIMAFT